MSARRESLCTSGCGQPRNICLHSPAHTGGLMPAWCHGAVHVCVHKGADSRPHAGSRGFASLRALVCGEASPATRTRRHRHPRATQRVLCRLLRLSQVRFLSGVSTLVRQHRQIYPSVSWMSVWLATCCEREKSAGNLFSFQLGEADALEYREMCREETPFSFSPGAGNLLVPNPWNRRAAFEAQPVVI